MDRFDHFPEFTRLLRDFPKLDRMAAAMTSPNPQDDHLVKLAIVGFSNNMPAESWGINHYQEVMKYQTEMSPDEFSRQWRAFACLAMGHLLGLYAADRIKDLSYLHGTALLAGFMFLYPNEIEELTLSG